MNSKTRYLVSNMGWMTISNFASKILVFLMVPFYTRVVSASDYGVYDIGYTTATLLAPLITANIAEALMRSAVIDKNHSDTELSSAVVVSLFGIAITFAFCMFCSLLVPNNIVNHDYLILSGIILACDIIYILFSQYAKGIDEVRVMAFGGLINSALLVFLSILFVVYFRLGVRGCFYGTSLSLLIAGGYMAVRCEFWRHLVRPSYSCVKEMVLYGFPLSINTVGWWANNVMGRYFVAYFCGTFTSGLLAAAYKIPSIPKVIQQIFVQAWQISSIRDFDSEDSDGFFSSTYNLMCVVSSTLTSLVILTMPVLAMIMFAGDFYEAWRYVPLLMVSVVFNCLASVVAGPFMAVGDSKPIATSSIASIACCLFVSVISIPLVGVQGATLASAASSIVIWVMRRVQLKKYIRLRSDVSACVRCFLLLSFQITLSLVIPLGVFWSILQTVCFVVFCIWLNERLSIKSVFKFASEMLHRRRA